MSSKNGENFLRLFKEWATKSHHEVLNKPGKVKSNKPLNLSFAYQPDRNPMNGLLNQTSDTPLNLFLHNKREKTRTILKTKLNKALNKCILVGRFLQGHAF